MKLISLIFICFVYLSFNTILNAENSNMAEVEAYVEALMLAGEKNKLAYVLDRAITKTTDIKVLKNYIRIAEDAELPTLAERAYRQILFADPENKFALKGLGRLLFYRGNYFLAEFYLLRYNIKYGGDYLSYYMLGLIMLREDKKKLAYWMFERSLDRIQSKKLIGVEVKTVQASIYTELKEYSKADTAYKELIKLEPDNLGIMLDYTDMLIRDDRISSAEKVLYDFSVRVDKIIAKSNLFSYKNRFAIKDLENLILRADIYRTSICIKEQELGRAFSLAEMLGEDFSQNYQAIVNEADVYSAQGNWRKEQELLRKAIEIYPEDRLLEAREKRLWLEHSPIFTADVVGKFTYGGGSSNAIELITTETLDYRITDYWKVGAITVQDNLFSNNINYPDGTTGSFNGLKQQTEFYTQFDFAGNEYINGSTLKLSYYIADNYNIIDDSGFGLYFKYLDNYGSTEFEGTLRKPYWDLPSAVVNGAYRNRLALGRTLKIIPDLTMYADIGFNNYGINAASNVDNSVEFHINATYIIPEFIPQKKYLGENSQFSLSYYMDSEIFYASKEGINSAGQTYKLLPIDNRLVNTFLISYYNKLFSSLEFGLSAGYAFDLMGQYSNGPVVNGNIKYNVTDYLELHMDVSHYIGVTMSTYVGGGLKLYYIELFNRIWNSL